MAIILMPTTMKVYSVMVAYKDPDDNMYPEHTGTLYSTAAAAQKAADKLIVEAPDWFDFFQKCCDYAHPYAFVEPLEILEWTIPVAT